MTWRAKLEATSFNIPQFPIEGLPEIAVAGRSNVGKSTLINALLGAKLAHVAGTPGKTRSVNFYAVEYAAGDAAKGFRLVDLPGYGYAARSRSERREWSQLTSAYVEGRKSLILVCHLVDFRHGLMENDRLLQEWLYERGRPIMVLFTKADKIARGKRRTTLQQYVRDGLKSIDVPIATSGSERSGIEDLRKFIEKFLESRTEEI
ncbi:MAG: ribosome biogenesis GTP-binding protein YihA/YsxC [Synergistaceae bacterium]|jgi:GTP-binding protein|nr:ribosome biogenesis GTP-binding protein YihA/YsxC [Synergistaceae bacterium]